MDTIERAYEKPANAYTSLTQSRRRAVAKRGGVNPDRIASVVTLGSPIRGVRASVGVGLAERVRLKIYNRRHSFRRTSRTSPMLHSRCMWPVRREGFPKTSGSRRSYEDDALVD